MNCWDSPDPPARFIEPPFSFNTTLFVIPLSLNQMAGICSFGDT